MHGNCNAEISVENNQLYVNGKHIRITAEKDPKQLKWNEVNVDVALECRDFYNP